MSSIPGNPPSKSASVGLFVLALAVRLLWAALIPEPGYMDTADYTAGAMRLGEGSGATEPFLWNYLGAPPRLPAPAFGYWMPLPALLGAPFWAIGRSFFALQIPFAILAALLTTGGAWLAWRISGQRRAFWGAGGLLLFSGYYFPYWSLPETFAPFAVTGALFLWSGGRYWESGAWRWAALTAGAATLAYLTRSDGLLCVGLALCLPLLRRDGRGILAATGVTAALLAPWIAYNLAARGAPLPTGGLQTLWLTRYDDLFCYTCDLSWRSYLAWGWPNILASKGAALTWNLQTLLGPLCYVFLAPFVGIGAWRLRRQPAFVLAWVYLALLGAAMTFAFTFPGPRGGLLHSAGALLPFVVAAALVGVERAVIWAGGRRGWNLPQAQAIFTGGCVALALALSGLLGLPRLAEWRTENAAYHQLGAWLRIKEASPCAVILGDAPRFWTLTRIPALNVPNAPPETVAQVAQRYGACWLYLDHNHPQPLREFYAGAGSAHWQLVQQWESGKLYQYTP